MRDLDEKDRPSMRISQPICPVRIKRDYKVWESEEQIEEIVLKQRWEMYWRRDQMNVGGRKQRWTVKR